MDKRLPVSKYLSQSKFSKIEILLIVCIAISAILTALNLWLIPVLIACIALYVFLRAPRITDDEYEHMLYQLFYNNPVKYRFDEEYEAILLFVFHPKVEQRKIADYTAAGYDLTDKRIVRGADNEWRSTEYRVFNLHFEKDACRIYTVCADLWAWTMTEHTYTVPYTTQLTTETKTIRWRGEQKTQSFLRIGEEILLPIDTRSMDYPEILKHFNA
jgi:hypothetical protein